MSNLPPNPFVSQPGANANPVQAFNHNQYAQVPLGQLPPGYGGLKDNNSNSPLHGTISPQNNAIQNINNFNQSASSSPAFNQPGLVQGGMQGSPMRPFPQSSKPLNQISSPSPVFVSNPNPYTPNYQPQKQINDNVPPLVPPSQHNQPLVNGPPLAASMPNPTSSSYSPVPPLNRPPVGGYGPSSINQYGPAPNTKPSGPQSLPIQHSTQFPGPPLAGPTNIGTSVPPVSRNVGPSVPGPLNPPYASPISGPVTNPPISGPHMGFSVNGPRSNALPPNSAVEARPVGLNGPLPPVSGPPKQFSSANPLPMMPSVSSPPGQPYLNQPVSQPGLNSNIGSNVPTALIPPMNQNIPVNQQAGPPSGPTGGPLKSNMQSRYPQMPQASYNQQSAPQQSTKYPQQYNAQGLTQQMGQLSVTKQGFDQLWGHHMIDLLQTRHILPEYPEDPPEIKLGHQFADSPNCSPEIFRCTLNKIPETNSLLQKSRLPLGILIHPFKDLNHLPVIQCATIVRCRACRTYINPFVYFVDAKRWKCNLCYRVNDLPEEFQYDPVSKSYGDPSRRPEIKSATIEFIAPGEYMLRPPQPAVYLFLFDVSQIARDSGYLQVVCDVLMSNLDQLPGDARTQIGFICYDTHVHYYSMGEGLARPKEMTVLDIDDIFLPSPESLLVNLGERREAVCALLGALPARAAPAPRGPAPPASALGAALQAAYRLMAPTGGRITVFQTCLPTAGPGALHSREDPNARSSKDVNHLNPATDFYKRLALDCSGAQLSIDLFLLNSQYSDLATLSGMSKFSGGSVYHVPLYSSARPQHVRTLQRMLTRYLTRKIGFEAVMRVRCTRGISIHTFHGNFFVRSTDLLSLPNVSPDVGFGMQLTIEESLSDLQQVCFQAALLYTSSKGERRIRVHTLALPLASTLPEVLHAADQHCIIGLVSKMAVDRCVSASLAEAREALTNVAADALSAHRLAQNAPAAAPGLPAPAALRLLPLYLLALLKRKAFRTGTSTRLDDRVADMCSLKCLPLEQLLRLVYPALYPLHALAPPAPPHDAPCPPRLHLSAERINSNGAYLLDDGECMIIYVCHGVAPAFLADAFGVSAHAQLGDEGRALPRLDTEPSALLHAFIDKLNDDRPYASEILILKDNSPSRHLFLERLVDDRVESAFSYYEFLQHIKSLVK
ncbi:protein transport protein Sec24A [Bombyx mori]|uniref:Protein transport protein Sec24A n=1 Tax=Bombyx mori TaxID=7091 RepID=A0A8R2R1M4_BOMMO|nr:protein transport protein Sec24A [Bombyx mori]XP_037874704.1 protein transport protein Sec24A [Bombyx mori]